MKKMRRIGLQITRSFQICREVSDVDRTRLWKMFQVRLVKEYGFYTIAVRSFMRQYKGKQNHG